jgi:hypothetical protein
MISPRLWPGLAVMMATTSCAEGSADFHARYEPDFTPGKTTISVFGVFHEGRMSRESWLKLGPPLSAALGEKACEPGYDDHLSIDHAELAAGIDESVRDEGITEELLERLAPSAEGEMILVVTINGHTTLSKGVDDGSALGPGGIPQPGRGARTRGGQPPRGARGRGAELSEIGISGTLFSVPHHRSVARLKMDYSGSNLDDAIAKFVARMSAMVPGSTCKGWRWASAPPR